MGRDNVSRQVTELRARFPEFTFRLIPGHGNDDRIEAVRRSGPGEPGLYALVSTDPAEVAAELKHAA